MDYSPTFLALDEMIKKNWVTDDISEFNQVLDQYEQDSRITPEEHKSLIQLYLAAMRSDDWT